MQRTADAASCVVSASYDRELRVWQASEEAGHTEFALSSVLTGHSRGVTVLAMLDGLNAHCVSGDDSGEMIVWNLDAAALLYKFTAHHCDIAAVCALHGASAFASGDIEGRVHVWQQQGDDPSWECIHQLQEHDGGIHGLVPIPKADPRCQKKCLFASASADGSVRVWSATDGTCEVARLGHTDEVTQLAVLPDGRLVSGSDDGTVRVWGKVGRDGL